MHLGRSASVPHLHFLCSEAVMSSRATKRRSQLTALARPWTHDPAPPVRSVRSRPRKEPPASVLWRHRAPPSAAPQFDEGRLRAGALECVRVCRSLPSAALRLQAHAARAAGACRQTSEEERRSAGTFVARLVGFMFGFSNLARAALDEEVCASALDELATSHASRAASGSWLLPPHLSLPHGADAEGSLAGTLAEAADAAAVWAARLPGEVGGRSSEPPGSNQALTDSADTAQTACAAAFRACTQLASFSALARACGLETRERGRGRKEEGEGEGREAEGSGREGKGGGLGLSCAGEAVFLSLCGLLALPPSDVCIRADLPGSEVRAARARAILDECARFAKGAPETFARMRTMSVEARAAELEQVLLPLIARAEREGEPRCSLQQPVASRVLL